MPEKFLISKALDVSLPALGKSSSMVIKGLLVVGLIGWGLYSGYITLVKPHFNPTPTSTTNQRAAKIVNQHFTVSSESCWVNILGIKTLCFKDKTAYKIIQKEGEMKLEKK